MEKHRGLRITTWNDIVIMQETKIQRKDLRDDMVLVPGWDVFFSLPKHKKGYSGVAIFTRNSVCAPIRAEEGITGVLTPPNSTIGFRELPEDQQIGGYPSFDQLGDGPLDAATLDSEGRCVVLEFPAFVLIGVYSPANRDESRDDFRLGFLNALDARVRNLVALGKRVFLTGDLNIIREEIDTANAAEQLKKQGISIEQYISTPARRMLNQLLLGGKVIGERDEGREKAVMWDLCRLFHPTRKGMFTCWEQKINARPGNFGSRIDYVLCSFSWNDWFAESDIQEGLVGSDHCPVYAVLKEKVEIDGAEIYVRDIMSAEMFKDGVRQREWSVKDLLPTSARLIPEFNGRRSIRDMFARKPSLLSAESSNAGDGTAGKISFEAEELSMLPPAQRVSAPLAPAEVSEDQVKPIDTLKQKRPNETPLPRPAKRTKSGIASKSTSTAGKGQSSLMGFFKPKTSQAALQKDADLLADADETAIESPKTPSRAPSVLESPFSETLSPDKTYLPPPKPIIDPIVAKESWSKLLGKRVVPKCSDHDEPCISMKTKKAGENCGRSFYMCSRPLGPTGQKEKKTQWRGGTFICSSDWSGDGT